MLGNWQTHNEYQQFVLDGLSTIYKSNASSLNEYEYEISKVYILDLDPLKDIVSPLYSRIGRTSELQPQIFRSFVLMLSLGIALDNWLPKLKNNPVLRIACGFSGKLPKIASYYDFINRIINLDEKSCMKLKKHKPAKKYKKGEKMPPKHPGMVEKLVKKILEGRRLNNRPERTLQEIFAKVSIQKSFDMGLIPKTVSASGDGICIITGASPYGVKTCECKKQGIYKCDCTRKFSDPNATWGWDSHNEHYFYGGYTGYFISTYNKAEKLDLPLYLRLVEASRHDSVSAVVALAEFRDLCPDLKIDTFISDSASDNYATYELLHEWNINAVIALNPKNEGNCKYPTSTDIDKNGNPVCPCGYSMINWGFCKDRCRIKWRCPKKVKGYECKNCVCCSPSSYGRTIYTKPSWDLRLFTRISRGSDAWKSKMKQRTAAERVNNRILNHYGIEASHTRGKKRISFFTTIAAINVHLDAQLAKLKTDMSFHFQSLFC